MSKSLVNDMRSNHIARIGSTMELSLRFQLLLSVLIRSFLIFTLLLLAVPYAGLAETDAVSRLGIQRFQEKIPAPMFSLPDLSGKKVSLDRYRGKALVLYFWTTY